MPTCPHCAHTWGPTRRSVAVPDVDTSALSDAALHAHYKRTSHLGDVRFFLDRAAMPDALRLEAIALRDRAEAGLPKAETLRQLTALQDRWRRLTYAPANEARLWANLRRYTNAKAKAQARAEANGGNKPWPRDPRATPWPPVGISLQSNVPPRD